MNPSCEHSQGSRELPASVVLLGTSGGPLPIAGRLPTSQVLLVEGNAYLVDCGNGVVQQLLRAGVALSALRAAFVTHLHADHVADYFHLIISGRPIAGSDGFRHPVPIYGPGRAPALPPLADGVRPVNPRQPAGGMRAIHDGVLDAFSYIVNSMYVKNGGGPDIRDLIELHEISLPPGSESCTGWSPPVVRPFPIYEDDLVRVTATLTNHPPVYPCFAFRFDTAHGSVTFSGDGTPSANVIDLARGSELLVHEVMFAEEMLRHGSPEMLVRVLQGTHTDVRQIGALAAEAGVHALALSHLVPMLTTTSYPPELPDGRWIDAVGDAFGGRVYVGRDLLSLPLRF